MEIGIPLIVVGAAIIVYAIVSRRRDQTGQQGEAPEPKKEKAAGDVDVARPRPDVADFHVQGNEARVTFDVPLPEGEVDAVLRDLLTHEAVEVIREKRHSLPIEQVTRVVALAGRGSEPVEVGSVELDEPGDLPPAVVDMPLLQFSHLGHDPLEQQFREQGESGTAPQVVTDTDATLGPIGAELHIPKAVDVGLRSLGVDPGTMSAGDLVVGMLQLYGYTVTTENDDTRRAMKGGQSTYIRIVPHAEGGYAELDESAIRRFVADFANAKADRSLLVTDKYGPFEVYQRERRDPRVRFVTRERLQKFVDSLALS